MISTRKMPLVFPVLTLMPEQDNENVRRYALRWDINEQYAENSFQRFMKNNGRGPEEATFLPTLPEPYDTEVKNLLFKMDKGAEREVRYFSRTAKEIWEEDRNLPEKLADISLEGSLVCVNIALSILKEYIEDTSDPVKNKILSHAMVYKFWNGQINTQMLKPQSGLLQLEDELKRQKFDEGDTKRVQDFLKSIEEYETDRTNLFSAMATSPENNQPSQ